jgi:hypothetical protein
LHHFRFDVARQIGIAVTSETAQGKVVATTTLPSSFTYDAPIITDVNSANLPKLGGAQVTISGTNFGERSVTPHPPPALPPGAALRSTSFVGHQRVEPGAIE